MTGGISMILLVFVVLLLVSFASLSIAAARADLRLSERYRTSADDYYSARNAEQEFLKALDDGLYAIAEGNTDAKVQSSSTSLSGSSPEKKAALTRLSEQLSFTLTWEDTHYQIEKTFPSGDNAQLTLQAAITPHSDGSFSVSILSERISSTQSFDYDSHLNVIQ